MLASIELCLFLDSLRLVAVRCVCTHRSASLRSVIVASCVGEGYTTHNGLTSSHWQLSGHRFALRLLVLTHASQPILLVLLSSIICLLLTQPDASSPAAARSG